MVLTTHPSRVDRILAAAAELNHLAVVRRPVLRAMFSRDMEVLGDPAAEAAGSPLQKLRLGLGEAMFGLWREHGLVRMIGMYEQYAATLAVAALGDGPRARAT